MRKKNSSKKFSVLLVDDEVDLLEVTKESIEPYFSEVFTASSVNEAVEVLSRHGRDIDMVVSDFKMPNQDGLALRNIILQDYPKVQFVMLTAYGHEPRISEARKSSDFEVIDKPTRPDVLIERLDNLFVAPDLLKSKEQSYLQSLDREEREAYHELSEVEKHKRLKKHSLDNRLKMRRKQRAG